MSSSCRFPILTPVARVTAACASSIEPRAASTAVSLRSPWECFSSGRFSAASAGCTFGRPGDRYAIRDTLTCPNFVISGRVRPRSARVRTTPSSPATSRRRTSRAADTSSRSWNSCRSSSRPRTSSCSSSSACCSPAAPADAIQSSSSPKHFPDSANAPSWAGTYPCIGLLLLRSGRQTTRTVTRRSPLRTHRHGKTAARGSMEDAQAAVTRATGVRIGKRQQEDMGRRAAAHVEAFYLQRVMEPAPEGWPLILTFDGKGIVMLPWALRPATAKARISAEGRLATRLSPGEKNGRKRMCEVAGVYDAAPAPRTPEEIISTPAQKRKKKKAQAGKRKKGGRPREPQARNKWLTASVTDDIPAVIAAAFDEAERRDPGHQREWVVLIDGNNTQIEAVTAEAARRGVTVTIVIDFIHVLEYCWKAAWSFFDKGEPAAEEWVAAQARKI